ncbi:unnamed protein product, partial [Adineta ricciae]
KIFSNHDDSVPFGCWSTFKCVLLPSFGLSSIYDHFHYDTTCFDCIEVQYSSKFWIPAIPISYDDLYLAFEKADAVISMERKLRDLYICENGESDPQPKKKCILFQSICDGHLQLLSKSIAGQNEKTNGRQRVSIRTEMIHTFTQ